MSLVFRTGEPDVVGKEDAADRVLVAADGVRPEQKLDLVLPTVLGGDSHSQILETVGQLLPVGDVALPESLHVLVVFSLNGNPRQIAVLSGRRIPAD